MEAYFSNGQSAGQTRGSTGSAQNRTGTDGATAAAPWMDAGQTSSRGKLSFARGGLAAGGHAEIWRPGL